MWTEQHSFDARTGVLFYGETNINSAILINNYNKFHFINMVKASEYIKQIILRIGLKLYTAQLSQKYISLAAASLIFRQSVMIRLLAFDLVVETEMENIGPSEKQISIQWLAAKVYPREIGASRT